MNDAAKRGRKPAEYRIKTKTNIRLHGEKLLAGNEYILSTENYKLLNKLQERDNYFEVLK